MKSRRVFCRNSRSFRNFKKIPVPIGATGFAAARIWREVNAAFDDVYRGKVEREPFMALNDATKTPAQLVEAALRSSISSLPPALELNRSRLLIAFGVDRGTVRLRQGSERRNAMTSAAS